MDQTTLELLKLGVTTLASLTAAGYAISVARSQRDIAKQQKNIAREAKDVATAKFNFDLFGRRLVIYTATRNFLIHVSGSISQFDLNRMNVFNELIPEASFLFGKEISDYMTEIVQQATQYNALQQTMMRGPHYCTQEVTDNHRDHQYWFWAQMGMYHRRFVPYLDFSDWRTQHWAEARVDHDSLTPAGQALLSRQE